MKSLEEYKEFLKDMQEFFESLDDEEKKYTNATEE